MYHRLPNASSMLQTMDSPLFLVCRRAVAIAHHRPQQWQQLQISLPLHVAFSPNVGFQFQFLILFPALITGLVIKAFDSSEQTSPRGVLEITILNGESDGISSESSLSNRSISSDGSALECHCLQWRNLIGGLLLRKKRSMMRAFTFPPVAVELGLQGSLARTRAIEDQMEGAGSQPEVPRGRPSWRSFDYQELAAATDNFSPDMLIGKGGHAEVYKGCLPDGQLVAVKKLTKRETEERFGDFLSELGIIAHVNHPNDTQLLGFSVESGLHLVLKF